MGKNFKKIPILVKWLTHQVHRLKNRHKCKMKWASTRRENWQPPNLVKNFSVSTKFTARISSKCEVRLESLFSNCKTIFKFSCTFRLFTPHQLRTRQRQRQEFFSFLINYWAKRSFLAKWRYTIIYVSKEKKKRKSEFQSNCGGRNLETY